MKAPPIGSSGTLNLELETLRSALPLSPLGYAAYMSEASLKKGVGRLKELETWNYIQSDFADDTVFHKMLYPMSPRPCRGGARGGVSDIKDRDVKS